MKYFLLYLLVFFASGIQAQSADTVNALPDSSGGYGTLIFYRETGNCPEVDVIPVVVNGLVIAELITGSYYRYEGTPGLCVSGVAGYSDSITEVDLYQDDLWFIRCDANIDNGKLTYEMKIVQRDSAEDYLTHNRLFDINDSVATAEADIPIEMILKPHSWIQMLAGGSFSNATVDIPKFTTSITPGTNVYFGGEFGHAYGKSIDLSGAVSYHFTSSDVPDVIYANFTYLSLLTNLVLHFPYGNGRNRINAGTGFGMILFPRMRLKESIDATKNLYLFKYGPVPLYQLQAEWEHFYNSFFSLKLGLRYNSIHFSLNSIEHGGVGVPIDQEGFANYKSVDGSSFELYGGLCFHLIPR